MANHYANYAARGRDSKGRPMFYVLPQAPPDKDGGRPDLVNTQFVILDDPTPEQIVDTTQRLVGQADVPVNAFQAMLSQVPELPQVQQQPVAIQPVQPPPAPPPPAGLSGTLVHPAALHGSMRPTAGPIAAPRPKPPPAFGRAAQPAAAAPPPPSSDRGPLRIHLQTPVAAGRFRADDVIVEPRHITIVFGSADFELPFEPPMDQDIVLSVDTGPGTEVHRFQVRHFGLVTSLPQHRLTVLMMPRGDDPQEPPVFPTDFT